MQQIWIKKNDILENIYIEKLVFWWNGFAKLKHDNPDLDGRVIFVTWWAIPWSIVNLRVLKKKKAYIETQILDTIKKSDIEVENKNNKYWISWWWRRINIPYNEQLKIKNEQVKEAFNIIEKKYGELNFLPIQSSPLIDWYRNKVEFSFWKYISHKNWIEEHFNLWFHKQWEYSKVEDFDWAPLIDEISNEIFREIKKFTKTLWLPVYDQMKQNWFFRHILIRKSYFTNEMMILLGFNPTYFETNWKINKNEKIKLLKDYFINLAWKYSIIKSIYFSHNSNKADISIWDLELIYWEKTIKEKIHWLYFNISPTSFFQTNSAWAEKLYEIVMNFVDNSLLNLNETRVLDLYAWTGTIWMIFAKIWVREVISVELVTSASKDWEKNSKLNWLDNIKFVNNKVEDFLEEYLINWEKADLLVIDPPRTWMHPKSLPNILKFNTNQIIYVSCNPSTLTRELSFILENSNYIIEKIQAMDMFPHTHHIETVVSLKKN